MNDNTLSTPRWVRPAIDTLEGSRIRQVAESNIGREQNNTNHI